MDEGYEDILSKTLEQREEKIKGLMTKYLNYLIMLSDEDIDSLIEKNALFIVNNGPAVGDDDGPKLSTN